MPRNLLKLNGPMTEEIEKFLTEINTILFSLPFLMLGQGKVTVTLPQLRYYTGLESAKKLNRCLISFAGEIDMSGLTLVILGRSREHQDFHNPKTLLERHEITKACIVEFTTELPPGEYRLAVFRQEWLLVEVT